MDYCKSNNEYEHETNNPNDNSKYSHSDKLEEPKFLLLDDGLHGIVFALQ